MLQGWFDNFRDLADLKAQIEMAQWAFWMVVLTVISCAVAAGGLVALWISLRQTRTAIRDNQISEADARSLGQANSRAYLHVDHLEFSADGNAAIVTVKNTGSTPATLLMAGCEAKAVVPGGVRAASTLSDYNYKIWPSLPAGESRKFRVDFTRGSEFVQQNKQAVTAFGGLGQFDTSRKELTLVVGRIVWSDVFGFFLESGFVFYTEDVVREKVRVPNAVLPAFRIIGTEISHCTELGEL